MTDGAETKPLRDEDLTYARTVGRMMSNYAPDLEQASETIRQLITEIERLRALEIDREWASVDEKVLARLQAWYDASHPIVEAVASVDVSRWACPFPQCDFLPGDNPGGDQHSPDCPVTLSRTLLNEGAT